MADTPRWIDYVPLSEIRKAPVNPKLHDMELIRRSMGDHGLVEMITLDERTGQLISGHGRLESLEHSRAMGDPLHDGLRLSDDGEWLVPVVRGWASKDDDDAEETLIVVNQAVAAGGWERKSLLEMLERSDQRRGLERTGFDRSHLHQLRVQARADEQQESDDVIARRSLAERFVVPPFSVLDTRQGYWQDRKAKWLRLGIQSELGRGTVDVPGGKRPAVHGSRAQKVDPVSQVMDGRSRRRRASPGGSGTGIWLGKAGDGYLPETPLGQRRQADQRSNVTGAAKLPEWARNGTEYVAPGTSIFDPVLCELMVRWFSPPGGVVLDPFAGGSVRGIVSSMLGRRYVGIDLSEAQVAANREQRSILDGGILVPGEPIAPVWLHGDARRCADVYASHVITEGGRLADLVFTCPPYFDLEVYSDDPNDLSQCPTFSDFVDAMGEVMLSAQQVLLDNRFVVLVVGEVRSAKSGFYHGLVPNVIGCAQRAGLAFYNEAILVTMVGSLPLRTVSPFTVSRKLGRTHQSVLVFVKGDPAQAAKDLGQVDYAGSDGDQLMASSSADTEAV